MNNSKEQLRHAFAQPSVFFVKLLPDGFEIGGQSFVELAGRVIKTRLIRKLFEDGALACQSKDGITAENGTLCDQCRHPRCRPILRIHLADLSRVYLIDLNASSAQNLFEVEDRLQSASGSLDASPLLLTVINHGHWGEVLFKPQS